MDAGSYKEQKEAFVADGTGSTHTHINLLSFAAVLSIALHALLLRSLPPLARYPRTHFFLSFATLVLPLLLAITTFASAPGLLCALLGVPALLLWAFVPPREDGTPLPSAEPGTPRVSGESLRPPMPAFGSPPSPVDNWSPAVNIWPSPETGRPAAAKGAPLPALSAYRAHMLLLTALCILGVDFRVFPRMLGKCETYGVSLMDIGVGSFAFSQGLIAARPLVRDPSHLSAPLGPKLARAARGAAPVLALGVLRVLLVKGTAYPEHVSEYGAHWNFFLSLGLLPVLQVLLHPLLARGVLSVAELGFAVCVAHQLALSAGLADYILHAPRVSLLAANKEGVLSLPGYLALHLLGLASGTVVLPHSPSAFRRMRERERKKADKDGRKKKDDGDGRRKDDDMHEHEHSTGAREDKPIGEGRYRENDKTAMVLFSWACVYWTLLGLCTLFGVDAGVSRRMVNAQYILWVAAYNTSFLLAYVTLDLVLAPSPLSTSVYDPVSGLKVRARAATPSSAPAAEAPALLEAVNRNGLAFFLIANLATGAVNLSMQTMYANDAMALGVLVLYALAICGFAWVVRGRRLF